MAGTQTSLFARHHILPKGFHGRPVLGDPIDAARCAHALRDVVPSAEQRVLGCVRRTSDRLERDPMVPFPIAAIAISGPRPFYSLPGIFATVVIEELTGLRWP